jgi:uncharacterized sodium:solute symporter family permease YidK
MCLLVEPHVGNGAWGGLQAIVAGAPEKFHMVRPWNDPELPWIRVFFGGLWPANIFYWGCNQFITQGSLSARNVWHGQMGAVFAGPVWALCFTPAENLNRLHRRSPPAAPVGRVRDARKVSFAVGY